MPLTQETGVRVPVSEQIILHSPFSFFSLSRVVRYTIVLEKKMRVCASFITRILTRILSIECRSSHCRLAARQYVRTRNNGKGVKKDRELFSSNRGISHLNEACHIDKLSRGFVLGLKFSQTTSDRNVQ